MTACTALVHVPRANSAPQRQRYDLAAKREIVQGIADRVANGETAEEACRSFGINRGMLWKWCESDEECGSVYARARSVSAWAYDDEALQVARSTSPETAQADRLRVDTLKWAAAKRRPREYSEKMDLTSDGEKIAAPQVVLIGGRAIKF